MVDFIEPPKRELNPFIEPKETSVKKEPMVTKDMLYYYSLALERAEEDVSVDIEAGNMSILDFEAGAKADSTNKDKANERVQEILVERPEDSPERLAEIQRTLTFGNHAAPDMAAILARTDAFSAQERKIFENLVAAQRIVDSKREQRSEGVWASVGYFADVAFSDIVQSPVGALAKLTGIGDETFEGGLILNDLAEEASNLLLSNLTKEEFETQFGVILDRVADSGFFSEENPFYLEPFLELVKERGAGQEARFGVALQFADIIGMLPLTKLFTSPGRVVKNTAALSSQEKAVQTVTNAVTNKVDSPVVAEGTSVSMLSPTSTADEFYSAPELAANRRAEAENKALAIYEANKISSSVLPEVLERVKGDLIEKVKEQSKNIKRRDVDYDIVPFGKNLIGRATYGTSKGTPFKDAKSAGKLAESIGGEVRPVLHEGSTHYKVIKDYNIPTEGLQDATDINEISGHFLSSIMSTTARTTPMLDAILKRGEMQGAKLGKDLTKLYESTATKVSGRERDMIRSIFEDLRDGPEAHRTSPYTESEFRDKYFIKTGGEYPKPEVVEHYKTIRDISDLDYYITADSLLAEAVNNGETMVKMGDTYFRGKKIISLGPDDPVWNMEDGATAVGKRSDLKEDAPIYQLDGYTHPTLGPIHFVAGNPQTRRLYHSDALPYNAGGHRVYDEPLNGFIKQENDGFTIPSGMKINAKPTTIMGVRTEKQGKLAAEQWNKIASAVKDGLPEVQINRIIQDNNDWNIDISDVADFQEFAATHKIDPTKEVKFAFDGDPTDSGFTGSKTVGEVYRNSLYSSRRRGDTPLVGYGGRSLGLVDPVTAIERGMATSVARASEASYLHNAIGGWVKAAKAADEVENIGEIVGLPPKQFMREAKLKGKSKASRKLAKERDTITFRANLQNPRQLQERKAMEAIAEFVYDKDMNRLGKAVDWAATKDPAGFLRWMAFNTKLGLFAIDQLYVQGSQLINTMGIVGPKIGLQSMLSVSPMRLALIEDIPEGALKKIANTQARFTGMSADEFIELRNWLKQTGRTVLDNTFIEENNSFATIGKSKVNKFLDYGQTFFKEGELIARIGAASASILERKAKGITGNIFDDYTTRELIRRQDIFAASMTNASSAPWQKSLLAVPLQFTTYHVRLMEQIFTDKVLTGPERMRLGLTHLTMYGAGSAPGVGFAMDRMGYNGDVNQDSAVYEAMRWGMLDTVLSIITQEDTALSSRLGVGEGLWDLFTKVKDEGLLQVAAGPGGLITYDTFSAFGSMVGNIFQGKFDYLKYDWNRFARNVTGYNRGYSLYMGARYSIYTSRKTEGTLLAEMSGSEVFLKSIGIPLDKEQATWSAVSNQMMDVEYLKKSVKEIQRLDNMAVRALKEENYEAYNNFVLDIAAIMELHSAIPGELDKIVRVLKDTMLLPENVVTRLIKQGKINTAQNVSGYTN